MLNTVLIAAGIVGVIGLILGALIAFTAKKYETASDPRVDTVLELLPGANCGGCGFAGCADMANAIVNDGISPSKCSACSDAQVKKIAEALGIQADAAEKKVAVVFCSGSLDRSQRRAQYNGVMDCRSASVSGGGGGKACRFGCLGYGSCVRACPFGAIELCNGLAFVHPELCRGCGKCENVCPRKLIRLVPASAKVHVYCNSLDKPAVRRKYCSSPCLTCKKCVRVDEDHMQIHDQFVRVNYNNPPTEDLIEKVKCPTGALQTAEFHRSLVKASPAPENMEDKK